MRIDIHEISNRIASLVLDAPLLPADSSSESPALPFLKLKSELSRIIRCGRFALRKKARDHVHIRATIS